MCLTAEALFLFLSLLPPNIVETTANQIVVHADVRDAIWKPRGTIWCTGAPTIDAVLLLKQGEQI